MRIAISSGHALHVRGARGNPVPPQLDERDENVKVVDRVTQILNENGVPTVKFHDDISTNQSDNLSRITSWHNKQTRDYDCSVHFNATPGAYGTEVLYVTQADLAARMSLAVSDAGEFKNRGAKKNTGLAFLNNTNKPAILIETCFCDSTSDSNLYRTHFDAICRAIASTFAGRDLSVPLPPDHLPDVPLPPERPAGEKPTIAKGDKGPYVEELQSKLGVLAVDGDFGETTETWVEAFQKASGISADGVVGPVTWAEVDALQASVEDGKPPLSKDLESLVFELAQASEIADYSWPDRGMPPPGYIAGVALCFAHAVLRFKKGDPAAQVMAQEMGSPDVDILSWYKNEFAAKGMSNKAAGLANLRHLFVFMIGLGPRESSGKYFCGRDLSADNVQSETAEAGLYQTSWNIKGGSSAIAPLLDEFWTNPQGFLSTFKDGITPTAGDLNSYGSGDGVKYQWLSRYCPLFHVLVTGVGLRVLRQHWGPANRREVSIQRSADTLLQAVQDLVENSETVA